MPRGVIETIINLVYPALCVSCKRPNHQSESIRYLCSNCYLSISRHTPPFCVKCGRGLKELRHIHNSICGECLERHYNFDQAWSVCNYDGIIKSLIHAFKYKQKLHYKIIFGRLFDEFLTAFKVLRDVDLIIPIPLHAVRLREREYNQSYIIAQSVSQILNKPVTTHALERWRNTKPQVDLDENKRETNINGCFRLRNAVELKEKSILLIDDVFTTGTTLSEAAKALKSCKPSRISCLTLAS
ncbi:ComF family protein [Thermoproteota archaeon]